MTDRVPIEVLENGAIRYAEYDSDGDFVQYRYLLLADDATVTGTALNKANLLPDDLCTALGIATTSEIKDALTTLSGRTQIEIGSYTGTGTYGSDNPNSLTFDVLPKIIFLYADDDAYYFYAILIPSTYAGVCIYNGGTDGTTNSIYGLKLSTSGKTVSWYNGGSAFIQHNTETVHKWMTLT